jgi:hypothetical protein
MELVPIVITALEIVSVLTIVTLVISYVGYRIKSKSAAHKVEPSIDLKPNFVDRSLKRVTRLTKEIVHTPRHVNQPNKSNPQKARKELPKEKVHAKPKPIVEEPTSKRLQVIKNLPSQSKSKKETVELEPPKEKKNLSSLGDDILNKYADDDGHTLFSLKTNKGKQKD